MCRKDTRKRHSIGGSLPRPTEGNQDQDQLPQMKGNLLHHIFSKPSELKKESDLDYTNFTINFLDTTKFKLGMFVGRRMIPRMFSNWFLNKQVVRRMDDIEKFKASYQVWVHPTFGISECVKQLLSVGTDNNFPLIQKHSTEIGTLIQLIVDFVFHQSGDLRIADKILQIVAMHNDDLINTVTDVYILLVFVTVSPFYTSHVF